MFNIFKWLGPKQTRKTISSGTLSQVRDEWRKIDVLVKGGSPSQLRQAVINADRAFDLVLKDISIGNTMGERLKEAQEKFRDYEDYQAIWEAHKVRNSLVHEAGFEPPHFMLTQTVKKFRNGLLSLRITL